MRVLALGIGISLLAGCSPGASAVESSDLELRLVLEQGTLAVEDELEFSVELVNHSKQKIRFIRPVDGSFDGMREPLWELEFLGEDGQPVPSALGYGPEGRCGMVNDLAKKDIYTVPAGESLALSGEQLEWVPPMPVRPSARPGSYGVRLRYRVSSIDEGTQLELVSEPVTLTIEGGDPALWACRTRQLEQRADNRYTQAGPVRVYPRPGGGYLLLYGRSTHQTTAGRSVTSSELFGTLLDEAGQRLGEPTLIRASDDAGYLAVLQVPGGLIIAETPGAVGGRAVDVTFVGETDGQFKVGGTTRISEPPGNPYIIQLARNGERVALAFEGPGISGAALMVQLLDLEGTPLGKPWTIAKGDEYVGFSQLISTPSGFQALWTAGSGQGRMRRLGADGAPVGDTQAYTFGGQFVAAGVALDEEIQIVYSDASMSGQDRSDTMGLYLLRLSAAGTPLAEPVPLSPRDREVARFGDAAWLPDGRYARVFDERGPLHFGLGSGPTTRLTDAGSGGGSAAIWAHEDRFVVAWSDHRDDTSTACTALGECSMEAYFAVFDEDGKALLPATRVTHEATPQVVAPYHDWEQYCGME